MDISGTLVNFLGVTLTGCGITYSLTNIFPLWYGRIYLAAAWFTRVNQGTSSALIAVNRAYAMVIPMKYPKIWRKNRLRWLQIVQFLPGIAFAAVILTFSVTWREFPEYSLRLTTPQIINDNQKNLLYKLAGGIEVLLVVTIFISYSVGIASILQKESRKSAHDFSISSAKSRAEKSATYMGISICLLEFVYFLYSAFSLFFTIPAHTYFSVHSTMTDLYSSLNCYLLLAFSKSIRRRLLRFFGCNQQQIDSTSTAARTASNIGSTISRIE